MNAAELDTLPIGAVVLSRSGVAYQQITPGKWAAPREPRAWPGSMLTDAEPFTLIYHPLDHTTERTEP